MDGGMIFFLTARTLGAEVNAMPDGASPTFVLAAAGSTSGAVKRTGQTVSVPPSAPKPAPRFQFVEDRLREIVACESVEGDWVIPAPGSRGWCFVQRRREKPAIGWELNPGTYLIISVGTSFKEASGMNEALCKAVGEHIVKMIPGAVVKNGSERCNTFSNGAVSHATYMTVTLPE